MSNEAALALICVFLVKMFLDALGMAMDHGVRIGVRTHATICKCPACEAFIEDLKKQGKYRLWFDELDQLLEKDDE